MSITSKTSRESYLFPSKSITVHQDFWQGQVLSLDDVRGGESAKMQDIAPSINPDAQNFGNTMFTHRRSAPNKGLMHSLAIQEGQAKASPHNVVFERPLFKTMTDCYGHFGTP